MPTPFFARDQNAEALRAQAEQPDVYLSAGVERRLLNWLCAIMPSWVRPDHLTLIGFLGAALCAVSDLGGNVNRAFFLAADLGMLLNWFGDLLDGSLARFRGIDRPRYGYLVDHAFDAINCCLIYGGLGLTPYVPGGVALYALSGVLLLSQYFLMAIQLSEPVGATFLKLGPTELRVIVIYLDTSMYLRGPLHWRAFGVPFSPYVVGVAAMGTVFIALFLINVWRLAAKLAREGERAGG